jgi:hypothetical protein
MDATTVAVDLAKTVFELARADARWRILRRQRLNRAGFARFLAETSPLHVVMEACGTAHCWGRVAQQNGHRATLLPPAYVRPAAAPPGDQQTRGRISPVLAHPRRPRGARVGLSSPGGRAAAHTAASLGHHGARPAWPQQGHNRRGQ